MVRVYQNPEQRREDLVWKYRFLVELLLQYRAKKNAVYNHKGSS